MHQHNSNAFSYGKVLLYILEYSSTAEYCALLYCSGLRLLIVTCSTMLYAAVHLSLSL